jgi:3-hydroxyisobutyrate dehydrogenase-like beta-hydroxyacid dehydrogenase
VAERMVDDEHPFGLRIASHQKDPGIALGLAREVAPALLATAPAAHVEAGPVALGDGDDDGYEPARAIRQRSAP